VYFHAPHNECLIPAFNPEAWLYSCHPIQTALITHYAPFWITPAFFAQPRSF
jgi:hypothetical protein